MNSRRSAALMVLLACALALFATNAPAQTAAAYPEKAVRIIVPFPAGGAPDILARMLPDRLRGAWTRPVIVENVSGAGGATGTARAAKAPADGYPLLVATGPPT